MVSIRKLAELSGVAQVTVWRALHGAPNVRPEVRARVLALAEAHHYRPNRLVEGLITGQTRTIGYIALHLRFHFHARVCDGIINAAHQDQVHVITLNNLAFDQLPLLVDQLIEQRVDGVIYFNGHTTLSARSVLGMWSHDIVPIALFDSPSEKLLDRIDTDERQLAQLAVDYLLRLGHQRLAYCGLHPQHARNREMARQFRLRGLSEECFIEEAYLSAPNPNHAGELLDLFLNRAHPPTAIICFQDQIAVQLLLRAQQRGLRVPGDLSILGCVNDIVCDYLTPTLTSIEQHPEEIGRLAYEWIKRRREEGTDPGERTPETLLLPAHLVIRESCGPPEPRRHSPTLTVPALPAVCPEATPQVTPPVAFELRRLLPHLTGAHSKRELMACLGLHDSKHFVRSYLQPALTAGYLERTIPDKPHSSKQRYRLTALGRQWVEAQHST